MKTGMKSTYTEAVEKPNQSSYAANSDEAKHEGTMFKAMGYLPSMKSTKKPRIPRMPKMKRGY